jgi:hypothetical protein
MLLENTEQLLEICLGIFNQSKDLSLLFAMPLFIARVAWMNVSGAGQQEYTQAIKGLLAFFVLTYSFEYVLEIILEIPKALEPGFSGIGDSTSGSDSSWVPDMLRWILESVGLIFFHVAHLIQFVFLVLLCSLAPIIFLLGSILGIGLGVKIFYGLLLVTACWPIVWVSFDQVGSLIAEMDISWLGYTLSEILINVMKAFGPIGLAIAAFSSEVGNTIKQGARFVTAGATGGASIATNSIRQTKSTIHKSSEAYKAHQQRKKEKNYVRPELRI